MIDFTFNHSKQKTQIKCFTSSDRNRVHAFNSLVLQFYPFTLLYTSLLILYYGLIPFLTQKYPYQACGGD